MNKQEEAALERANEWFVDHGGCLDASTAGDSCGACANCLEWAAIRQRPVVMVMPTWRWDDAAKVSRCPIDGCDYSVGFAQVTRAVMARTEDSDRTKGLLVLQGEHVEAVHPEAVRPL